MTDGLPWWATLAVSWVPGIGVAIWQLVNFLDARRKRAEEREDTAAAQTEANALRDRELVSQGVAQVVTNLRTDIEGYRVRLAEVTTELNRVSTLARRWNAMAWSLLGKARQSRQIGESLARKTGETAPLWTSALPDLPGFDEIGPHTED